MTQDITPPSEGTQPPTPEPPPPKPRVKGRWLRRFKWMFGILLALADRKSVV